MRFPFDGKTYVIEFARDHKKVEVPDPGNPLKMIQVESSFPYTTARIIELAPDGKRGPIFKSATVGAWHKEKFSLEKGRLHALRLLSKDLDVGFKKAMWESYIKRPKGTPKADPKGEVKVGEIVDEQVGDATS